MTFDNLNTEAGLSKLNEYLADKSYVEGFEPSQADVAVFEEVLASVLKFPHLTRWASHMFATKGKFHQYASILIVPYSYSLDFLEPRRLLLLAVLEPRALPLPPLPRRRTTLIPSPASLRMRR